MIRCKEKRVKVCNESDGNGFVRGSSVSLKWFRRNLASRSGAGNHERPLLRTQGK